MVYDNGINVVHAIVIHGETFTLRVTPVRFARSRHPITDDWQRIWWEINGRNMGIVNLLVIILQCEADCPAYQGTSHTLFND